MADHDEHGIPAYEVVSPVTIHSPLTDIPSTADLNPMADGLRIMQRQRELSPLVGGFCQLTTVHRDRIETRILRRWPS